MPIGLGWLGGINGIQSHLYLLVALVDAGEGVTVVDAGHLQREPGLGCRWGGEGRGSKEEEGEEERFHTYKPLRHWLSGCRLPLRDKQPCA